MYQSVVGGCNLICTPEFSISANKMGFLSPDGLSYSFDDRSNGYARGEGLGVIVVKRLSDALRNGDAIRAVIRATGTSQNGRTSSITQTNQQAQEELLRKTYKMAGLDPGLTRFVEAHGTGTAIGDPIEANALGRSLRDWHDEKTPVYM
jgi:acyl transferase domain-containing protein